MSGCRTTQRSPRHINALKQQDGVSRSIGARQAKLTSPLPDMVSVGHGAALFGEMLSDGEILVRCIVY